MPGEFGTNIEAYCQDHIYERSAHHSDSAQQLQSKLELLRTIAMMDFALVDVIRHGPKRVPDSPDTEKRRKSDPR